MFKEIFVKIKTEKDYDVCGFDIDYKIIVDKENSKVILQFEESDSTEDWINNFSFIPYPLKLENKIVWTTLGYARAYKSTKGKPVKEFMSVCLQYPNFKWCIYGWSFGSAMAKIAARHFYIRSDVSIHYLITYGDVKTWLNPFVKKICKWADNIFEFVTINDFVTWCVPFYHRENKCRVGGKFGIKSILNTPYNHQHYENYDYSEYEN